MSVPSFDVGDSIRCQGLFRNLSGDLVDPTGVVFKLRTPAGTTTTYTYGTDVQLVKSTTGTYYADVTITESGPHWYRFAGTGAATAAEEARFDVDLSRF